ncbi:MAG: hypothetical protein HY060_17705 [Proteobacteria bacterium]|nr:hypothetical protein [Pseudomonadota bacterium]
MTSLLIAASVIGLALAAGLATRLRFAIANAAALRRHAGTAAGARGPRSAIEPSWTAFVRGL